MAGLVLGPVTGLLSVGASVHFLSELGVALLLFLVGLELSVDRIREVGRPAVVTGLVQMAATLGLGTAMAAALGFTLVEALFLGLAVTFSRTVVMEENPALAGELRETRVTVVRGDGSDPAVLTEAGVSRARFVVSTLGRTDDNATLLALVPEDVPVLVPVFDEMEAAWVRERGGRPVVTSELGARRLLAWYEQTREPAPAWAILRHLAADLRRRTAPGLMAS